MADETAKQLAALHRMTPAQLREKYIEVYGESTVTKNRTWLIRRIAWRIQSLAEGDLSQRAKERAHELARDADIRILPPRETPATALPKATPATRTEPLPATPRDARLPAPGTILTRQYKGKLLQVKVLADGFEFADAVYPSLSAVAKVITGSHCNGFHFFKLHGTQT